MGARALAKAVASALARQLGDVGAGAPAWSPSSLFASGEQGVWYDPSDFSTMFQDSAGTTPVTAVGQPVGRILDKSGRGNHASQATSTARPILPAAGYRLRSDFIDDVLPATLPAFDGEVWVNTPYGHYMTTRSASTSTDYRLPLNDASEVIIRDGTLTTEQRAAISDYFGTTQAYTVFLSPGTTINNTRIYTGGGTTAVLYVGANGATVSKNFSANADSSYDVSADGLTAPVAVVFHGALASSAAMTDFRCENNQLTGSIPSLSANTALTIFLCNNNQLTGSIPSLSANTAMMYFFCYNNQLTGSIPSLSANTAMMYFFCYNNQLTGSIPSLSANTAMMYFFCYNNQLTGSIPSLSANTAMEEFLCHDNQLTGSIPSLSANTAMTDFRCNNNQLTGSIPSLSANTAMEEFLCHDNQLTGSIPSLSANTAMMYFFCYNNQLTGSIPSLSANTAMEEFLCHDNQLTGYTADGVSPTLGDFRAQNNLLTQAAVDAILAAFDAAGRNSGTRILNLGGTGNAAPSAAGITSKNNLLAKGWAVTTN